MQLNADIAGIVIKSRATSDSIWRQPGAIVWTKLIPAGNLVSSHRPTSDMYPPQFCGGSQAPGAWNLLQFWRHSRTTHLYQNHRRPVHGICCTTDLWCVHVTGVQRLNSLEYQICTAPGPFDTHVTGLVGGGTPRGGGKVGRPLNINMWALFHPQKA